MNLVSNISKRYDRIVVNLTGAELIEALRCGFIDSGQSFAAPVPDECDGLEITEAPRAPDRSVLGHVWKLEIDEKQSYELTFRKMTVLP